MGKEDMTLAHLHRFCYRHNLQCSMKYERGQWTVRLTTGVLDDKPFGHAGQSGDVEIAFYGAVYGYFGILTPEKERDLATVEGPWIHVYAKECKRFAEMKEVEGGKG